MWTERMIVGLLLLIGLINCLPVVGVLSAQKLQTLYGLAPLPADMALLLRHRAVLFGLLGALIMASAFWPALRPAACLLALVSMASFIILAAGIGDLQAPLRRIVVADGLGLGFWALLVGLLLRQQHAA